MDHIATSAEALDARVELSPGGSFRGMPAFPFADRHELAQLATGRETSLFAGDVAEQEAALKDRIAGRRFLVIGGAGSIGRSVVHQIAARGPKALHVVDQSENGLVEVVRDLRSRPEELKVEDFRTFPVDYGSPVMRLLLAGSEPYDVVLNFAAIKHVRSEKDLYSLLQMFDTNLVKQVRFMEWLRDIGFMGRYFCVSTDKAANPVSLMGASKRLMEHVLFSEEAVEGFRATVTSARFANVAFSDGSLLDGFLSRFAKRQPLAAPRDTRRYFVSLEEASHICLLAALCTPDHRIVVPRLSPENDLLDLQTVAERVITHFGLTPVHYADASAARAAVAGDVARGRYPLLLTPLDTAGEKPYEEFVGEGETAEELGFATLYGVAYQPAPAGSVTRVLSAVNDVIAGRASLDKSGLVLMIGDAIRQFRHHTSDSNLDQRM